MHIFLLFNFLNIWVCSYTPLFWDQYIIISVAQADWWLVQILSNGCKYHKCRHLLLCVLSKPLNLQQAIRRSTVRRKERNTYIDHKSYCLRTGDASNMVENDTHTNRYVNCFKLILHMNHEKSTYMLIYISTASWKSFLSMMINIFIIYACIAHRM